jgi:hypothetical protein
LHPDPTFAIAVITTFTVLFCIAIYACNEIAKKYFFYIHLFAYREAFGEDAKHEVYADFKTIEEEPEPSFYIHVVQKQ